MTNDVKIERFNVVPDPSLYEKLGKVGYSFKDAVSELVDNSIDARIPGKKLIIDIDVDEQEKRIKITDNGRGMTKEIAKDAIILGKSSKKNEMGLYGLGLKTAGLALGNIITLKTKPKGSEEYYMIEFDRHDFEKKSVWELDIKTIKNGVDVGTSIIISDLHTQLSYSRADRLEAYFAKRYRSYIKSGTVEININSMLCVPDDSIYLMEQPLSLKTKTGHIIKGFLRLQPTRPQKTLEYGFDLYRHGRLIDSYNKIGFGGTHGEKAIICGELELGFCPVNFTKNAFLGYDSKYKAAENEIKSLLKSIIPMVRTKVLNKEKIEQILELNTTSSKIMNLDEFKAFITGETLTDVPTTELEGEVSDFGDESDEEEPGLPKHGQLRGYMESCNGALIEITKQLSALSKERDEIQEIKDDQLFKDELDEFSVKLNATLKNLTILQKNLGATKKSEEEV